MDILGIRVDNLNREDVLKKVLIFLNGEGNRQIATVNPEFILTAQKDDGFKKILNGCDLNIADGIGIRFAFWRRGEHLKSRLAGTDLMDEILKIAEKNNLKIFLAANSGGLSTWEETATAINRKYPTLDIDGINLEKNASDCELPDTGCHILFCNFGAPYQEKFINTLKNDNIKLAMGVGGSFDYLTGKIRRAPGQIQKLGLEWLWRIIQQPRRLKRIWNSIIIFPIKVIFHKI